MTTTYVSTDSHEDLIDFALSLDATHTLTMFDGGLIVREIGSSDLALVARVTPEAERDAFSPFAEDDVLGLIESTFTAGYTDALTREGLTDWDGELIEIEGYDALYFVRLSRVEVMA